MLGMALDGYATETEYHIETSRRMASAYQHVLKTQLEAALRNQLAREDFHNNVTGYMYTPGTLVWTVTRKRSLNNIVVNLLANMFRAAYESKSLQINQFKSIRPVNTFGSLVQKICSALLDQPGRQTETTTRSCPTLLNRLVKRAFELTIPDLDNKKVGRESDLHTQAVRPVSVRRPMAAAFIAMPDVMPTTVEEDDEDYNCAGSSKDNSSLRVDEDHKHETDEPHEDDAVDKAPERRVINSEESPRNQTMNTGLRTTTGDETQRERPTRGPLLHPTKGPINKKQRRLTITLAPGIQETIATMRSNADSSRENIRTTLAQDSAISATRNNLKLPRRTHRFKPIRTDQAQAKRHRKLERRERRKANEQSDILIELDYPSRHTRLQPIEEEGQPKRRVQLLSNPERQGAAGTCKFYLSKDGCKRTECEFRHAVTLLRKSPM